MLPLHSLPESSLSFLKSLKYCISCETLLCSTVLSHVSPLLCRTSLRWGLWGSYLVPALGSRIQQSTLGLRWRPLGCPPGSDKTGREGLLGAVCESSEQRELPIWPVHLYLLGLRPQAPPNTLLRLGKMSPFVGWQGIPSASFGPRSCLSQVWSFVCQWITSLKLFSATSPLWTSATPLVCLLLDTFPFYLLLFNPTIGFSLSSLCDHSILGKYVQAYVPVFIQSLEIVGVGWEHPEWEKQLLAYGGLSHAQWRRKR